MIKENTPIYMNVNGDLYKVGVNQNTEITDVKIAQHLEDYVLILVPISKEKKTEMGIE